MRFVCPLLVATLCAASLAAQERSTTLTTDLGFVNAAGNTSVTTFNVGEQFSHATGGWTFRQQFTVLYGRSEGETSAEQFRVRLRADHALSERLAVYTLVNWDRNEFAGLSRRFEEGVGLAFKATTDARTELAFEAGFGATQQRNTEGVPDDYLSGRAAGRFKRFLTELAYLQQTAEFVPNFEDTDDYRVITETTVVAPLSASIALKASYVIRYDNVPEPGFVKSDRVFTTGVQINW